MLAFNKNTISAFQKRAIGTAVAFLSQYHGAEYGNPLLQETVNEIRDYFIDRVCEAWQSGNFA